MARRRQLFGRSVGDTAARARITQKFRPGWNYGTYGVSEPEAFDLVQRAVYIEVDSGRTRYSSDPPVPTVEDALDALRFAEPTRNMIDFDELRLIAFARSRGATWQQLAESLGYSDRQSAERRYQTLRRRWPGYKPPEPVVGPSDGTSDGEEGAQP